MSFQIHALDPNHFTHLFDLDDEGLRRQNACWMTVNDCPGFPCRISLEDAPLGTRILLANYYHQPAETPYRASHAVFVRPDVARATPAPNSVPDVLSSRLISWRAFDANHRMISAAVVDGRQLSTQLHQTLHRKAVAYVDLHNAGPGCFAARATRLSHSSAAV